MFQFKRWFLKEMQVMILPMRTMKRMGIHDKLPVDHPTAKHGIYVDKNKFDSDSHDYSDMIVNGKFFNYGKIVPGYIDTYGIKHPPEFYVKKELPIDKIADLKKPGKKLIRVNMITNSDKHGMRWSLSADTLLSKNYYQITSIAQGAIHFFCITCNFKTPFCLATYEKSEPRSKPTTYGNLKFGKVIGKLNLLGRERDFYDQITIS